MQETILEPKDGSTIKKFSNEIILANVSIIRTICAIFTDVSELKIKAPISTEKTNNIDKYTIIFLLKINLIILFLKINIVSKVQNINHIGDSVSNKLSQAKTINVFFIIKLYSLLSNILYLDKQHLYIIGKFKNN